MQNEPTETPPNTPEKSSITATASSYWQTLKNEASTLIDKCTNLAKTNYELAITHLEQGQLEDAKMRFKVACKLNGESFPDAYYHLGRIYFTQKKYEQAQENFQLALQLNTYNTESNYMLERIKDRKSITQIPSTIISSMFDSVAYGYDELFVNHLNYQGHKETVKALMYGLKNHEKDRLNILDLGCGTGLVGEELQKRNLVKILDGVDLSNNMTAITKEKRYDGRPLYDNTYNQELISFLKESNTQTYDVITAANTFDYLGPLDTIFKQCYETLNPNGLLSCSLEANDENIPCILHEELDHFIYSNTYIEDNASKMGFEIVASKAYEITLNTFAFQYILQKVDKT